MIIINARDSRYAGCETDSMCTRSAVHAYTDRSDFSSLLLLVSTRSFFFFAFFSFRFSLLLRRNPVDRGYPKCRQWNRPRYMFVTNYLCYVTMNLVQIALISYIAISRRSSLYLRHSDAIMSQSLNAVSTGTLYVYSHRPILESRSILIRDNTSKGLTRKEIMLL